MGTLRRLEREVLRRKVGNRYLKKFFRRNFKPKRKSALERGLRNLAKMFLGWW